jgi:hypothetical protein
VASRRAATIPVARFREAFEAEAVPVATVARRLGWLEPRGRPDSKRVSRTLGLIAYTLGPSKPTGPSRKGPRVGEFVTPETAEALCEALNVDPREVGL